MHVIFISRLAPDGDYRVFTAVCRKARTRNSTLGISGVLLFDGERFCQWLHGSAEVVSSLLTTIALDQRHADFKLLHLGGSDLISPNRNWCSGFVPPFALIVLASENMGATKVLSMFMNVLAQAALWPCPPLGQPQKSLSGLAEPVSERVNGLCAVMRPIPARQCTVFCQAKKVWPVASYVLSAAEAPRAHLAALWR